MRQAMFEFTPIASSVGVVLDSESVGLFRLIHLSEVLIILVSIASMSPREVGASLDGEVLECVLTALVGSTEVPVSLHPQKNDPLGLHCVLELLLISQQQPGVQVLRIHRSKVLSILFA